MRLNSVSIFIDIRHSLDPNFLHCVIHCIFEYHSYRTQCILDNTNLDTIRTAGALLYTDTNPL